MFSFDDFSGIEMEVYLYLFMILIVVHNGKSVMASGRPRGPRPTVNCLDTFDTSHMDTMDVRQ